MNPVTFSNSTSQTILAFLSQDPSRSFYSGEIAEKTSLSKGGTNQTLRELARQGVLKTEKKGRMIFYSVDIQSPLIRQFKVFLTIASLEGMVRKVRQIAERVVLFGSCARGEDHRESDIDLLVVSRDQDRVRGLVPEKRGRRKVQLLVKTPQEYIQLEHKEPVFWGEVQRGIVLWQKE